MIRAAGKLATVKFEPDTVELVPDGSVVNTLDGVNTGPRILIAIKIEKEIYCDLFHTCGHKCQ